MALHLRRDCADMCRSEGAIATCPDFTISPSSRTPNRPSRSTSSALVRDAVIRLTRLVQRAAIYPPGHPTVRLLLAPFLEAVVPVHATARCRCGSPSARERLIAAAGTTPPQEHESKWLAGQLHGRGVSTIAIEGQVDAEELLAFARWLSGPAQAGDRPSTPRGLVGRLRRLHRRGLRRGAGADRPRRRRTRRLAPHRRHAGRRRRRERRRWRGRRLDGGHSPP